jgi:hypothetical protein
MGSGFAGFTEFQAALKVWTASPVGVPNSAPGAQ